MGRASVELVEGASAVEASFERSSFHAALEALLHPSAKFSR
jgi:hypothetical protein